MAPIQSTRSSAANNLQEDLMCEAITYLRPCPANEARSEIVRLVEQGRKAKDKTRLSPSISTAKTRLEDLAKITRKLACKYLAVETSLDCNTATRGWFAEGPTDPETERMNDLLAQQGYQLNSTAAKLEDWTARCSRPDNQNVYATMDGGAALQIAEGAVTLFKKYRPTDISGYERGPLYDFFRIVYELVFGVHPKNKAGGLKILKKAVAAYKKNPELYPTPQN